MALYDADIIRGIRDGEDLDNVRLRIEWKSRTAWQEHDRAILGQIRMGKLVQMALQEPEDTDAHRMAEAWLRAEEDKLEDEDEVQKEHRRIREKVEKEYLEHIGRGADNE